MTFKKVVIWGYTPPFRHTHHPIHKGFYRAFKHLGYETLWLDDSMDVSNINFDNCLFLTEGQVCKSIPINALSKYVLHNCSKEIFNSIQSKNKLILQFYHRDVLKYEAEKLNLYTYRDKYCLYQPWATNLLPHEIELDSAQRNIKGDCVWIGSYNENDASRFENHSQLKPFVELAKAFGDKFIHIDPWKNPVSDEENKRLVNTSSLAPAIVSNFQKEIDYLSCRTMKNISYGHMGISNSSFANQVFEGKLVYSDDPKNLFYLSLEHLNDPKGISKIQDLMKDVQANHTYINRVKNIINCLGES